MINSGSGQSIYNVFSTYDAVNLRSYRLNGPRHKSGSVCTTLTGLSLYRTGFVFCEVGS
jgi:hypothetical protein